MFQLNSEILRKMGWRDYCFHRGIGFDTKLFEEDGDVKFFLLFEERKICYVIKEKKIHLNSNVYIEYKFIKVDFSKKKPIFEVTMFKDNIELMKLLRKYLACNKTYQRYFQINSIIL